MVTVYARLPAGCTVPSVPTGPPPDGVTYTGAGAVILLSNADEFEGLLERIVRSSRMAAWRSGECDQMHRVLECHRDGCLGRVDEDQALLEDALEDSRS